VYFIKSVKSTSHIVRLKDDREEKQTDDGGCSTRWQHVQQRNYYEHYQYNVIWTTYMRVPWSFW